MRYEAPQTIESATALLAAANWPTVAVQFLAQTTFQVLLAVPIIGAAILVAVLLGADLGDLLQGSLREIFTTIASTLLSEPVALVAFITAFTLVLLGGSVLMFAVKGGTVDVLVAANAAAAIVVLLVAILLVNASAIWLRTRYERKW